MCLLGKEFHFLYPGSDGVRQLHSVDLSEFKNEDFVKSIKLTCDITAAQKSLDSLSLQEQLRRERMRLFTTGVTAYSWNGTKIIIPLNDQVLIYDSSIETDKQLYIAFDRSMIELPNNSDATIIDPRISPDGNKLAFVLNDDLYVFYFQTKNCIRLTTDGEKEGINCGLADFLAQEEMDRYEGFWWSINSDFITFTITDESVVPIYYIPHSGDENPHKIEAHHYPFAGKTNPNVKLAVIAIPNEYSENISNYKFLELINNNKNRMNWKDDNYIARVGWFPDNTIYVEIENRQQNELHLIKIDAITGQSFVYFLLFNFICLLFLYLLSL